MSTTQEPPEPRRRIPLRVANKTAYVWDVDGTNTHNTLNQHTTNTSPTHQQPTPQHPHTNTNPTPATDIAALRAQHRICGVLTGTLPHLAQQNAFLGVPLVLMPEEAALLVGIGAAVLVDDPRAHGRPTGEALGAWWLAQEESRRVQRAALESRGAAGAAGAGAGGSGSGGVDGSVGMGAGGARANSEAAVRKRREREERKRRKAEEEEAARARAEGGERPEGPQEHAHLQLPATTSAPASAPLDLFAPPPTTSEPSTSTSAIDPSSSSSSKPSNASASASASTTAPATTSTHPYTITIPAPSSSLAWYDPAACTYTTLAAARAAGVWDYPAMLAERARCGVFKDLWTQGYFMGGGIKFGGEYLVYPGDPLRYHSHFAASVVESPVAKLRPMEIVAHGRLGTATKKAHLLCGWDDEKQEVSYLSIEWTGFG